MSDEPETTLKIPPELFAFVSRRNLLVGNADENWVGCFTSRDAAEAIRPHLENPDATIACVGVDPSWRERALKAEAERESLRSQLAAANERADKTERERDAYLGLLIDNDMGESCLVWLGRHADNTYGTERFSDLASAETAIRKAAGLETP